MILNQIRVTAQLDQLINKLSSYSIIKLMLGALMTDIAITIVFSLVLFPQHTAGPNFKADIEGFFFTVLIAPLLETLFFQVWIIKTVLKYVSSNKLLAISVSSILFGIAHSYSIAYVLKATLAGLIYSILYFSISNKKRDPIFYIFITHGTFNLIGFILTYFDKS